VKAFLGANFTQEERHVRRLGKIRALEEKFAATSSSSKKRDADAAKR
jgi:hypothetical protein